MKIEDITRWSEDMKFIYEWKNNCFLPRIPTDVTER